MESLFSLQFNGSVTRIDKYTFAGETANKYQRAIIDCVAMIGFMQLKDADFAVSGQNEAANKRILKEAVETRKAADVLLASGAIVLMGTWSNGIQVGPGEGFVRIAAPVAKPAKKSRKSNPNSTKAQIAAYAASHQEERDAQASEEGATCDWQATFYVKCSYDVDAPVSKPRYRVPLAVMQAACGVTPAIVTALAATDQATNGRWSVTRWTIGTRYSLSDFVTMTDRDFSTLAAMTAFLAAQEGYDASKWQPYSPLRRIHADVQAATVAALEDALRDDADDEIDALINAYAGYDIAAG